MPTIFDAETIFAVFGPWVLGFGLILTRTAALIVATPLFSSPMVPTMTKAGLVGTLALVVTVSTGPDIPPVQLNLLSIAGAVVHEAIVGAVMGLAVAVAFGALHFTGQMVGIQMGFAIANVVDPSTYQQVGVVAQLLNLMGLSLFLVFDGHLMILRAFFQSFEIASIGALEPQGGVIIAELVRQGGLLFSVGLKIALPVVCVVLLVNVGLATIARTVPQVNIFVIGFMITISLGLVLLGMAMPSTAKVFESLIEEAVRTAIKMSRLF